MIGLWLVALWLALLLGWGWRLRGALRALWHEPCLSRPVLIFESDDWAPAPPIQQAALARLIDLLGAFRDAMDHPPVMTLGVVLSAPMRQAGQLQILQFDEPAAEPLRSVIQCGIDSGCFAPQLHGAAHYWPAAFADWLARDPAAGRWCGDDANLRTETLPSALQSRWWNPQLDPPAAPPAGEAEAAAEAEARLFQRCFGVPPQVAVPPTFLWQDAVERGWYRGGVRHVVTPGWRWQARDADGRLRDAGPVLHNGQRSRQGLGYLVRECYFEPERGHTAEAGLQALTQQSRLARPTLLEIHRSNFIGDSALCERALHELQRLLEQAVRQHGELRFLSTLELAERIERNDADWMVRSLRQRLKFFVRRGASEPGLIRWFQLSGLSLLAGSGR